jgi:glycosyltransferase involved in cell wall biosynthesis
LRPTEGECALGQPETTMASHHQQQTSSFYPRVLHVDTTLAPEHTFKSVIWDNKIDYRAYASTPKWWRTVEQKLRMDIGLARKAIAMSKGFDVLLCGSEKVSIPLALLGCPKPITTIVHHVVPRRKAQLVKLLGVTKNWARVGVYAKADAEFMAATFGYPINHTFNYAAAPVDKFTPAPPVREGIILSAGAASRDYPTLVAALRDLPDYQTEIYASSRYKDAYRGGAAEEIPPWVQLMPDTPYSAMAHRITHAARFVVVPMVNTTQYGAGCTAVLEGSAAGKAVVATKTMGTVDYVIDGVTGFLVPPGDSAAMREAICKLWQDPALAHTMGQAGRKFCEEKFDPSHVNEGVRQHMLAAYQEFNGNRKQNG